MFVFRLDGTYHFYVSVHGECSSGGGRGEMKPGVRLSRGEWMLLLMLAAVQFTHLVDFMIVMPLGPQYMTKLGLTAEKFGWVVSVYGICASISGLLASSFMDRFDRKRSLLVLYSGFTLATFACAIASDYVPLLIARGLAGAFGGLMAANILAIVGDSIPYERRGTAMGIVMAGFSLALIVGVPAGLLSANRFGWWAPFVAIGSVATVVIVGLALVMPPLRGHLGKTAERPTVSIWHVFTGSNYVRAYSLSTALVFSSFVVGPFTAAYFVANVGIQQEHLAWIYVIGGIATLLTMMLIGRIADRFGKLRVFRVLALVTVVPLLLLTNLGSVGLPTAIAVSTLFMITTSGRMVPGTALITASAAPRFRGQFLSVNASIQQMAMGLAAALGGLIIGGGKEGQPLTNFHVVGYIATAFTVLSVILAGRLRRDQGDVAPDATAVEETEPLADAVPV
jgi:predicted MFS family arabinose efflux permease